MPLEKTREQSFFADHAIAAITAVKTQNERPYANRRATEPKAATGNTVELHTVPDDYPWD